MKKAWDKEIDINTDWGGDASTDNLPVSGNRVQQFLKDQLQSKAGYFYYDTANNRYLVFANKDAKEEYLENPQDNLDLLLGFFDAPFNYSAEIQMITPTYVAILSGEKGNSVSFTFDTKNKNGQSVGEDVIATFTITINSIKKSISQKFHSGQKVTFNVDDYIEVGTNSIQINIIGQTTLAATTVNVTYQVVDLALTDEFDISTVLTPESSALEIPYSISGYGIKTMEWYIDGERVDYIKSEDEINEVSTSKVKYIEVGNLSQGTHNLQFRAYTSINGEKFYSKLLYRDFMFFKNSDQKSLIAVATEFSPNTAVIQDNLVIDGITQFEVYTLQIALFNPTYAATTPLAIYLDDVLKTTLSMKNGVVENYAISPDTYGNVYLKLVTGGTTYQIKMEVEKSSASLEEITSGLTLSLRALGKSNNSQDKDSWTFGGYSTTFNDFAWNNNSGWVDNRLLISGGASITVNLSPLASDALISGKTLEFEFASKNIADNDAVICDLRNNSGTGLLITASEVSLKSANGVIVSAKYKAEENIRISLVINRKAGTANKCLAFIYVNGVLSGATNFVDTDNFIVEKQLSFTSEEGAEISLKELRFYDTALSDEQILNNYILYQDNADEMQKIYDRNNVYSDGTTDFSPDALSGQLPVMILTGNIPTLEATTDKNLQIDVDVEYINIQDPTRSFTLKNGALRPQGTSSMAYPKKNFRLYTSKKDTTILYDADGNVVEDRKYAFKQGAQPVNCWCFKADYAESSGTHNTGIARLWNDVMRNATIDNEYVLRTEAQKLALQNNYGYDVRTTIDGFPILMFYRLTVNSPLVFIGKYNFNNDKSTESVFGFKDIPGFDNSNMQCWEVLNNGNHLALFTDTDNWDNEWSEAFEGRYPDGNTDTTDLKSFADWMSTVTSSNFSTEKYSHLDVYKVAAYYVYLMVFGAVDQVVKNAMFTTEDGEHWYFINYDNDTINGLRNDGPLVYPPTIDRQTLDTSFASTVYAYAGHDSRLWNMLESDEDFMDIVVKIYQALYTAGLNYDGVIDVFDNQQAGKWCERVYNKDAQYKYIGPFADRGINNLFMLQGSRQSHRRWWLSERFALMDAKFVSGEYKANTFEVKLAGAPIGLPFTIKSGADMYYGYGVNDVPIELRIKLERGESTTFNTASVLNVGDPLRLYAAPYIEEIDIKSFLPYMSQISISGVYSSRLGTKLKKLILGDIASNVENTSLTELSGINQARNLEELNIAGVKGIAALNLSENSNLKKLEARKSALTSVVFASGCPLSYFGVPDSMRALSLIDLPNLTNEGLIFNNNGWNLSDITIKNCPNIDSNNFVSSWLTGKSTSDSECSLVLDGIHWTNVSASKLIRFGNFRNLSLKGVIEVDEITEEQITQLYEIYGNNCFNSESELYIKVLTDISFLFGPDTVKGLSNARYVVVSAANGETTFISPTLPEKVTFDDGLLVVGDIEESSKFLLRAIYTKDDGTNIDVMKQITLQPRAYPSNASFEGKDILAKVGIYKYSFTVDEGEYDGNYTLDLDLQIEDEYASCVSIGNIVRSGNAITADITVNEIIETVAFNIIGTGKVTESGRELFQSSVRPTLAKGVIIMSSVSNPAMMEYCYTQGFAANPDFMTLEEAESVTEIGSFSSVQTTHFNEFKYFRNVANKVYSFNYIEEISYPFTTYTYPINNNKLKCISFPYLISATNLQITGDNIEEIDLPLLESANFTTQSYSYFIKAKNLITLNAPKLKSISFSFYAITICTVFTNMTSLKELILPSLEEISFTTRSTVNYHYVIGNATSLEKVELPSLIAIKFTNATKTYIIYGNNKVQYLDLRSLRTSPKGYANNSSFYLMQQCDVAGLKINLASLQQFSTMTIEGFNDTRVEEYSRTMSVKIIESAYENIIDLDLSSLLDCTTPSVINFPIGELHLPALKKCTALNSPIVETFVDWMSEDNYSSSIYIGKDAIALNFLFKDISMLKEIYINRMTAPAIYSWNNTWTTGAGLPEDTEKVLYVPEGATGYDSSAWVTFLENAGYTISYTLPAIEEVEES